jgi:hypothetical protein
MAWKTIQKRVVHKHLSRISNIKVLCLENCFVREDISEIRKYSLDNGKMEVDIENGKGRLRVHSNLWYEFDYK